MKRQRALVLAAVAVIGGALVWFGSRGPDLDARAREYAASLQLGDWGHIYDMAPAKMLQLQPWKRDQFITMMRDLDRQAILRTNQIDIKPHDGSLKTMKNITFSSGSGTAKERSITVIFFRDVDDWRPDLFYVPLQVSLAEYPDQHERAAALLHACRAARITRIVRLADPVSLEVDRIPDYLAGKLVWADLFPSARDIVASTIASTR